MKRSIFFILLVLNCFLLSANRDSTRLTSFRGLYLNTYYPHFFGGSYVDYYQKFSIDYEQFYYNTEKYYSQTPALGIGYVISYKGFFIKADVNYWHGTKTINYSTSHKYTTDGSIMDPRPGSEALSPGTKYHITKDHIYGKLNINHLDLSFALAGNISRLFRIYFGTRLNFVASHNLKAKMDRTIGNYEVLYKTSQYYSHDTLLNTKYEYYSDNSIEKVHNIDVGEKVFFDFGICYNFRIKKQLFMADLAYETNRLNMLNRYGLSYSAITFKVSYVFKYSTYFGE
jgi:hypothetical protein